MHCTPGLGASSHVKGHQVERGEVTRAETLKWTLESSSRTSNCYGEAYILRTAKLGDESPGIQNHQLHYFCCYIPEVFENERRAALLAHGQAERSEVYLEGVGLPGMAKASGEIESHDIGMLLGDPYHFSIGKELEELYALKFRTALTVPLYFPAHARKKVGPYRFIGALVLYFEGGREKHERALLPYLHTLQTAAENASLLLLQELEIVYGQKNHLHHNMRLMKILLVFFMPAFARYHKRTGKGRPFDAPAPRLVRAETSGSFASPMPRKPSLAAAAAVVEGVDLEDEKEERLFDMVVAFVRDYTSKWQGGTPKMSPEMPLHEVWYTCFGVIIQVGSTQLVLDFLNSRVGINGEGHFYLMSASMGALATLLFATPAAPLSQPWVVVLAHTIAMSGSVALYYIFGDEMLWLQAALTASFTISTCAKIGLVHPPAAACAVFFVQRGTAGASATSIWVLVTAIYLELFMFLLIATLVNNLSPQRVFPLYWRGPLPQTFIHVKSSVQDTSKNAFSRLRRRRSVREDSTLPTVVKKSSATAGLD